MIFTAFLQRKGREQHFNGILAVCFTLTFSPFKEQIENRDQEKIRLRLST
jgi:hypothetical protein